MKVQISKYLYLACVLLFMFLICEKLYSQNTKKIASDSAKIDNSEVLVVETPSKKINKYRKSSSFDYSIEKPKRDGFWSLIRFFLSEILRAIFSNKGVAPYIRYVVVALIIALVIYLVYKAKFKGLFISNSNYSNGNEFGYCDEDINEENLELKLKNAITERDFRLAIRFYYILLLKHLNLKELIKWELGKTNKDYQNELINKNICKKFNFLSKLYEYSWYGNFAISEHNFDNYRSNFDSLLEEIK